MLGLVFDPGSPPRLASDLPEPAARPGWARVQVLRVGICATDLALHRGYMGFRGVPGHEFVGLCLEGPLQGRRVVGEINAACHATDCAMCSTGQHRHCPRRTVLGIAGLAGACAEQLTLPERNLLPVPDAVDTDAATFTEPLAAALHLADDLDLVPGSRALVAGDGKLGLLCAWALHRAGCAVTVAGRHPERQALLPASARHRTGLLEQGAPPADEAPFPVAVEATGDGAVLARLLPLVAPRGQVALKTTSERPAPLDLSLAVVNELRLVGSRCGPFAPALQALAEHAIPVRELIAARYPLRDAPHALTHAARRGTLKVLLEV